MAKTLQEICNQMKAIVEESTVKVEESYIIANKPIRSGQQILYITKPTGNYIKIKQFPGTFDKSKAWRFSTKQAAEEGLMDSMAVMGLDSYDRHQRIQNFEIIQD